MMLLRAEIWWFWHAMLSFMTYRTALIPGADWVLLVVHLTASFAFLSWLKKSGTSRSAVFISAVLSQIPSLLISISALLLLCGVLYSDIQIVALQLAGAVFYPLALLSPSAYLLDSQLYLWVLCILLLIHSILIVLLPTLSFGTYSDGNSYVEDKENMNTITARNTQQSKS